MPAKKKSSTTYSCPKKGAPYSLRKLIDAMEDDPELAIFIKDLLCTIHSGAQPEQDAALDCLNSYCKITDGDLKALCIPPRTRGLILADKCTDITKAYLLDVPAYVTANFRKKERVAKSRIRTR